MYHYSSPPPGWPAFDYTTSPPTSPHYAYYASQFATPFASPRGPPKRHNRKASYAGTKESAGWYAGQGFYEPTPDYGTPPRKHDPVSASFGGYHRRRSTMSGAPAGPWGPTGAPPPQPSHKRSIFVDVVDDGFEDAPRYVFREEPSPPRRNPSTPQRKPKPPTDQYFYYNQVPAQEDVDSAKRSRARRQSTSTRTPSKPKPAPAPAKPTPKATEADAARAGIPPGYSIKNWDPMEMPIVLLGSVFDANSLGKWIYDWTIFHHGASTPMADVAGDLWLLLIKLAGKVKRADECLDRIKRREAHEIVEDFLESGERLWARFKKLLKMCEQFMWKAAKREGSKGVSMGRNAGCEFVETIFGRDRELESTEKLMNSIRLWNMRFDANCEEILRRPTSA
ncbi:vegetative cell wall protein gp1 [Aspergillus ellipticus CBS 707.79]|uniref:Vegetative cell wall protein gp1 n=1 Tax=Aspergillus ellipticus CBS 707.79 TaxID=1448320 RepID=A0A319DFE1_9EURO|nr:vegetative cell wall protein gp1 [Aspergillus ellipticus CBS 707.79]